VPQIDCIAFSPHPDDAELFCGGLLIKIKKQGYTTAVVDLTQGELSTNGNPKQRRKESESASDKMQINIRKNLNLPDGNIENNLINRKLVIEIIRELRPKICLIPYWQDRHPDHIAGSQLLESAIFYSGLAKINTGQSEYRPDTILYYMLHYEFDPSFVVDISDEMDEKVQAIKMYESQFSLNRANESMTYINRPEFLESIFNRAAHYGQKIGVKFAEPYYYRGILKIDNIPQFFA